MPTNPYFKSNFTEGPDQALVQSLTIESIQNKGRDLLYIPRERIAFDDLYGEDKLSAFNEYYEIEAYLESVYGWGGERELVSKFGFEVRDEVTYVLSKQRFDNIVTKARPDIKRPREGDLIFIPLDNSLFEITFLQDEEVFYQLGKIFTYQIKTKRFEIGSEKFNTGIDEIDNIDEINATAVELILAAGGSGSFTPGEIVYQGDDVNTSSAMGEVVFFNTDVPSLVLTKVRGDFEEGSVIGFESDADWSVTLNSDIETTRPSEQTDAGQANDTLGDKRQSLNVIDNSRNNPLMY